MKNVNKIIMVIIGTLVGAGFASGREIYLFFGRESTGIPKEILKNYLDRCLRIPATDNVRSLNLSNCVAIMLYEVLRQQNYNDLLRKEPHKGEDFLENLDI